MGLSRRQRNRIWNKSNGHCWYCGCVLPEKGWHADHLKPIIRETEFTPVPGEPLTDYKFRPTGKSLNPDNDRLDNIVPSCAPCNLFKSTLSLEQFRSEIEAQKERLPGSGSAFRIAERFGIVIIKHHAPVRFWFEDNVTPDKAEEA